MYKESSPRKDSAQAEMKKNRLVVGDSQWADVIPEWLLNEIRSERLVYGLASLFKPDAPKVGDAEVVAYLMTASLRAPMHHEYAEVYIYLTGKLVQKQGRKIEGFMTEKLERGLTRDEERVLQDLRHSIYRARGGEIDTPLLSAMRELKKEINRRKDDPQLSLIFMD
jgi:hypothetical protein